MHSKKNKDIHTKESLLKFYNYIKKYLPLIIPSIILACTSSIISIIGPDKLKEITDIIAKGIMTGIDVDKVKEIGTFLIIIYLLGAIFNYIQGFIMATVTNKCSKSLRSEIGEKINKLSLRYFDNTSFGDILSRVTNDVDMIAQSLNQSITMLVSSVTLFIGSLIMMFVTDYIMAITAIVASLIGFAIMGIILKNSQKYFNEQQKQLGILNGHIEEIYGAHNIVKIYNGEDEANQKFDEINKK